jgi:geranylgeranyl diphosphate synthase, type II
MEEKTDNSTQRALSEGVPAEKADRRRIRLACAERIKTQHLVPPLPLEKLKQHAGETLGQLGLEARYLPFTVVVFSNELWRQTVARIPYDKRLLLLPQCLRDSQSCPAPIDALGLLCKSCGKCVIDKFVNRAQALGYATLVAEGSPVVMALIESGQVQATVGVSCLEVLERVFPYMEAGAVPGIAVPLLIDGCRDTRFDEEWLAEAIETYEPETAGLVNLTELRQTVQGWFERQALSAVLGAASSSVTALALEAMSGDGKRYRPMLTAGVFATLTQTQPASMGHCVRQAAVAVECFHKASLIHDDIEDEDDTRYDHPTLHREHGVAIALNAGDYLVGAGYRLLSELECEPGMRLAILQTASQCHQVLCMGQGEELDLVRRGQTPSVEKVLEIFAQKTAPAFEAALKIGAILAGAPASLLAALSAFSRAVGIAYQVRDDLRDGRAGTDEPLSILTAMKANDPSADAVAQAQKLLDDYRQQAVASLEGIDNADCKAFLRKVVTRIFDHTEPMECCDEYLSEPD